MHRIDHFPQFLEPHHHWFVQDVLFHYFPQDLVSFPRLITCVNIWFVLTYDYLDICVSFKNTASFSMCVLVIFRNGIVLNVLFDFLLFSFNIMLLSLVQCKSTGA